MASESKTLELIKQRQARHGMDGNLYHSDETYQNDLEQIWHKEWIFAGHTFEIEKAGEYIAFQLGHYPVIVVRDAQGKVNAFHNSCRHRGTPLCSAAKGKVAKLVCPYHSWTYELDGNLIFAGSMGETSTEGLNLKSIHCEIVNTYIYICVAEVAPDFERFRQDISPFLAPHNLENCKVAHESTIVEKGNWKLVFENNRECYHCNTNHPELIKSFEENLSVAGLSVEDPTYTAYCEMCEAAVLPSQLVMSESGQYRITRIPLTGDSVSYTMDGKPAVARRLDNSGLDNIGVLLYFKYPSTWNHFLGDHALSFRVLPLSTGETQVTTKWIVPKDAEEGVDYDIDNLTKVWKATNDQDRWLVEQAFIGTRSPSYTPGPYSDLTENGVCQFVDWYCETMTNKLETPLFIVPDIKAS